MRFPPFPTRTITNDDETCATEQTAMTITQQEAHEFAVATVQLNLPSEIEGMAVSVDVSTGEHDADHRYFGTVTEVMEDKEGRHGVILLVQDAKPSFVPAHPLPLETAPKDGTIVRLLVKYSAANLDDNEEPQWTIGTNAMNNTGIDNWQFAGWNWTHDCFCEGTGVVLGWLPLV